MFPQYVGIPLQDYMTSHHRNHALIAEPFKNDVHDIEIFEKWHKLIYTLFNAALRMFGNVIPYGGMTSE